MSVFKCKMCGGEIEFEQGATVGTCKYCGTKQTLPKLDDDRRTNLYDRASHFRRSNDFDKAASIYEQILTEDTTDAEAYWSLVLCRYGIEYVEDPATHKRVPTVNRAQFTSIFDDDNYKSALRYADGYQRELYEEEAGQINEIQKGILAISQNEEPFDVFICYKETDSNGRRTPDSVLANDLYYQLKQEGFKVFFARITLEDKLGTAYEPYIFAALNSAKVMVVLGTKPEYFNAVWVKNEWSRYLTIVNQSGGSKMLIPAYKDMDPYDLPEEFSHLQAQDMSKLGFMQDLIRGIKKIVRQDEPKAAVKETVVVSGGTNIAPLLRRVNLFLEDGDWVKADEFCEQVLNQDPENAEAYVGKLMAELHVRKREALVDCAQPFDGSNNYRKAVRFGDGKTRSFLTGTVAHIKERNEAARLAGIYNRAVAAMNTASTASAYKAAAEVFKTIPGYKDSDSLAKQCVDKAEVCRKDAVYASAKQKMDENTVSGYETAIGTFSTISGWKDAGGQIRICKQKIEEIKAKEEADRLEREFQVEQRRAAIKKAARRRKTFIAFITLLIISGIAFVVVLLAVIIPTKKYNAAVDLYNEGRYEEAIVGFKALRGYKDSSEQIMKCETAIKDAETAVKDAKYNAAINLYNEGKYDEALNAFEELKGYKDSAGQITRCENGIKNTEYNTAIALYNEGNYEEAYRILRLLNYKDSSQDIDSSKKAAECLFLKQKAELKNATVGSTIRFGLYEQDNDTSNGKEEIEWKVLAIENNKALVTSKYSLDCLQYNESFTFVTWETCTLHEWLKGTFFKNAFSSDHQIMIEKTSINPSSGNDTNDKIFILSMKEVNKYFESVNARACTPTAYAIARGNKYVTYSDIDGWWLRSLVEDSWASYIQPSGNDRENCVHGVHYVRPAMWISIE